MKKFTSTVFAILLVLLTAVPASAHSGHNNTILEDDGSDGAGRNWYIPVCLHSNFDGPTGNWNLSYGPHLALNNAMVQWNAIGGEFMFYQTNNDCNWMAANHDDPFVQVGFTGSDTGYVMQTQQVNVCFAGFCSYHQGPYVNTTGSNVIPVWINDIGTSTPFYWGAGAVPPTGLDGWTLLEHELGHVIGINHTDAVNACGEGPDVMIECFYAGQNNRSLSTHDINAYAYWYGFTH